MSTFEEQFPSLRNTKKYAIGTERLLPSDSPISFSMPKYEKKLTELKSIEDIQNSCLDKQKVREAIEKLEKDYCEHVSVIKDYDYGIDELKKELGL